MSGVMMGPLRKPSEAGCTGKNEAIICYDKRLERIFLAPGVR